MFCCVKLKVNGANGWVTVKLFVTTQLLESVITSVYVPGNKPLKSSLGAPVFHWNAYG